MSIVSVNVKVMAKLLYIIVLDCTSPSDNYEAFSGIKEQQVSILQTTVGLQFAVLSEEMAAGGLVSQHDSRT